MEVRRKTVYRCLVPYCNIDTRLYLLRPCSQRVTLSLWCESQILGSRTAAGVAVMMHVSAECGQTKTIGEWANHVGSMLLIFSWQWCRCDYCHRSLSRIFTKFWLNEFQNYSRDRGKNSHHSFRMTPRQDLTHRVMLNNHVSARWSSMCQCLGLTSLGDSHPLATRHSHESVRY